MPFVSNNTAFVVGDIPDGDLKRLNGNREPYSRRQRALVPVIAVTVAMSTIPLMVFKPFGNTMSYAVFIVVMVGCYFAVPLWESYNPRVKNRKVWNRYACRGQLYHKSYLGFELLMAPVVAANIHACEKEAGEFLKWYALQGFGVFGPIKRDEQPALSELQYKLESGVGEALRSVGESFPPHHVNAVLAPCRVGYRNELASTEIGTEARIRELQERLEAARTWYDNAAEERAYQQDLLKALSA